MNVESPYSGNGVASGTQRQIIPVNPPGAGSGAVTIEPLGCLRVATSQILSGARSLVYPLLPDGQGSTIEIGLCIPIQWEPPACRDDTFEFYRLWRNVNGRYETYGAIEFTEFAMLEPGRYRIESTYRVTPGAAFDSGTLYEIWSAPFSSESFADNVQAVAHSYYNGNGIANHRSGFEIASLEPLFCDSESLYLGNGMAGHRSNFSVADLRVVRITATDEGYRGNGIVNRFENFSAPDPGVVTVGTGSN